MGDLSKLSNEELLARADAANKYSGLRKLSNEELIAKAASTGASDLPQDNIGRNVAVGGAGVAGVAAYGANRLAQPFFKRGADTRSIQQIGKQFNIPGDVDPSYIPQKLGELKTQATQAVKPAIANFDDTVLKTSVNDLTKTIETGQGEWLKKPTIKYGRTLDALSNEMAQRGVQIQGDLLDADVISKTIDDARMRGIPEDKLKNLIKLRRDIKKDVLLTRDSKGKVIQRNVNLTKAKGRISGYTNANQGNPTSTMLRENWGAFLEKSAPKDIQAKLTELNNSYKPFAESRRVLSKIKDPRTGKYDVAKLQRYLRNYVKQTEDTGAKNILRILSEGEGIAEPMPGVKAGVQKLESAKTGRVGLKIRMNKEVTRIETARSKSKLLLSKINKSNKRIAFRGRVGKGAVDVAWKGAVLTGAAKFLTGLSVAPQILQAFRIAEDPLKYKREQEMPSREFKEFDNKKAFEKWVRENPEKDAYIQTDQGQLVRYNLT